MTEFSLGRPQTLNSTHQTDAFDCGKTPLNDFLRLYALASTQSGNSRTFVVTDGERQIVGYYSLAATSVVHEAVPARVKQGQPRHPIPAILMARFAVDLRYQGQGLGRDLFRDALLRSLNITEELGARAFIVDAKDEDALCYYQKFQMMVDPQDPYRLYLLFKDIKKILAG
jgi:GNAT superfamily N-acetyltransferase